MQLRCKSKERLELGAVGVAGSVYKWHGLCFTRSAAEVD